MLMSANQGRGTVLQRLGFEKLQKVRDRVVKVFVGGQDVFAALLIGNGNSFVLHVVAVSVRWRPIYSAHAYFGHVVRLSLPHAAAK